MKTRNQKKLQKLLGSLDDQIERVGKRTPEEWKSAVLEFTKTFHSRKRYMEDHIRAQGYVGTSFFLSEEPFWFRDYSAQNPDIFQKCCISALVAARAKVVEHIREGHELTYWRRAAIQTNASLHLILKKCPT